MFFILLAKSRNNDIMILAYGILIFICIIITDLYHALFLSQGVVEDIYNDLLNNYKRYKK